MWYYEQEVFMEFVDDKAIFKINVIGAKTKQTFMGAFKVKPMLSPIEIITADKRYREILGNNAHLASEHVRQLAFALTQLEQLIIEAPPFWFEDEMIGGGHITDLNVVLHVLDKAIEAQELYKEKQDKEFEESKERLSKMIINKTLVKQNEEQEPITKEEEQTEE